MGAAGGGAAGGACPDAGGEILGTAASTGMGYLLVRVISPHFAGRV
jgi:hypothetical protein